MPVYKYLILFPIPEPHSSDLRAFMDEIAELTKLPPPYKEIPPHITFHRPVREIDPEILRYLIRSSSLQIRKTRITVSGLFPFGKQYLVLPVHATLGLASFWVELNNLLSRLPRYVHGEFDTDNTLHITVARKVSDVFHNIWPKVCHIPVPRITAPVTHIELHRKELGGQYGVWEKIDSFMIPD